MDCKEINSVDVAAYIAKQAVIKNYYIDLTKLQKILFACYGTYLAVTVKRLCIDNPKAWSNGPVFQKVYDFSIKNIDFMQSLLELPDTLNNSLPVDELKLLDKTVTFFTQYQSFQLVNCSRKGCGHWDKATNQGYNLHVKIDDSLIADYFKTIIKEESSGEQSS